MELRRTPLQARHVALGARLVPFGGWDMPVQYTGIVTEHKACRAALGLFDVCHMGEFEVTGPGAAAALDRALTNRVADLELGRCRYSLLCQHDGGVVDDLLVYRLAPERFCLVVNAGNIGADFAWLQGVIGDQAELRDVSDATGLLALQGPASRDLLAALLPGDAERLRALRYYRFEEFDLGGAVGISRTGYTGDLGYELCCPADRVVALWDRLLAAGEPQGLVPVGLGARDTLRLEAGLPLHGHEISLTRDPLSAGLERFVALDKPFVGRDALAAIAAAGPVERLLGFEVTGRGILREGGLVRVDGTEVGVLTSGTFSPSLDKSIGLGYLRADLATPGREVEVLVRDKPIACRLVQPPFYRPGR